MSDPTQPDRRDDRVAADVRAARAEYAEEEAEASEREAVENAGALDVALSLRISRDLDSALRGRAMAEQISPSALVRRILRDGLRADGPPVLTTDQVEQIVRRMLRESA